MNTYYERKSKSGKTWELCQNRFKDNPDHPHNVCVVATSHEQLVEMTKDFTGGIDWMCELLSIYGHGKNDDCEHMYNCCDCGGNECGCPYCWSCNACDTCKNKD